MEWRAEAFKELVSSGQCEVVLWDLDSTQDMLDEQIQLYREIAGYGVAAVAMADDEARSLAVELMECGVQAYCRKPPSIRELKALLRRASEHTLMKRDLGAGRVAAPAREPVLDARCDQMIGSSEAMQRVYDLVARVANLNASVLITGESGTGKELIARAIHNRGTRARLPFVPVSCGAIPETLIESELFGHEKGAFTGITGTRSGYFEQAGGGTLFLDEIGELTLHTQVKLLRVLQQREFSRLGSNRLIPLRARVLFATHRDLAKIIGGQGFVIEHHRDFSSYEEHFHGSQTKLANTLRSSKSSVAANSASSRGSNAGSSLQVASGPRRRFATICTNRASGFAEADRRRTDLCSCRRTVRHRHTRSVRFSHLDGSQTAICDPCSDSSIWTSSRNRSARLDHK